MILKRYIFSTIFAALYLVFSHQAMANQALKDYLIARDWQKARQCVERDSDVDPYILMFDTGSIYEASRSDKSPFPQQPL